MDASKKFIHTVLTTDNKLSDDENTCDEREGEVGGSTKDTAADHVAVAVAGPAAAPAAASPAAAVTADLRQILKSPKRLPGKGPTDRLSGESSPVRSPLLAAAPTSLPMLRAPAAHSSLLVRSLKLMGNPKQALYRLLDLLAQVTRRHCHRHHRRHRHHRHHRHLHLHRHSPPPLSLPARSSSTSSRSARKRRRRRASRASRPSRAPPGGRTRWTRRGTTARGSPTACCGRRRARSSRSRS